MKKILILMTAIALLLCLTGCPTVHKGVTVKSICPSWIMSSQKEASAKELTYDVNELATIVFDYSSANEEWGKTEGVFEFGLLFGNAAWDVKYTGAELTVGGGFKETTLGADANNSVTGMEWGNTYMITIQGGASVQVKIDLVS